jgi:hypothetical protein
MATLLSSKMVPILIALHLADALHTAAMRANWTFRPDARLNVCVSGFFVVEVRCGKVAAHSPYLGKTNGYVKYNNAVNFPPRQIGPMMSEVLTLGFPDKQGHVVLVSPDRPVPDGGRLF